MTGSGQPQVTTLRLTVGNQLVTLDINGVATGAPIVLRPGVSANVAAVWLKSNGEPETRVTRAVYQLNVTNVGGAPVTFERSTTDPFAGTIVCNAPATGTLRVSLYNVEEQHDLWGPFQVSFVAQN